MQDNSEVKMTMSRDFLGAAVSKACWCIGILGLIAGAHLTLRKSSDLVTVWWMPGVIGRWTERHGQLQNLFAYFLLACPYMVVLRSTRARILAVLILGLIGTALECAQLFIPTRWFDLVDIALSWAGLISAWVLYEGFLWLMSARQGIPEAGGLKRPT
jgi:hypothetical protein